jgi:hypothetical protein
MQGINIEVEINGSEKAVSEGEGVVFQCYRARVVADTKSDRDIGFVLLLSMTMLELAVDGDTIP